VVLDRLLPDGDGFDLLEEWRKKAPLLPIVVASERRDEAAARRLGASTYLLKPIGAFEVLEELENRLNPSESRSGLVVTEGLDDDMRSWIYQLRDQGINCRRVRSGAEIRKVLQVRHPVLILLDGRDGFRSSWGDLLPVAAAASIPVVLMGSGSDGESLLGRIAALGVTLSFRVDSEEELLRVASTIG
jgi:DNA-binding response OmpR family regulator